MHLYCIKQCLWMFTILGVNPEKRTKEQTCLYILNIVISLATIYLIVLFLVYKESLGVIDITTFLESLCLLCHSNLKLTIIFMKRRNILDLVNRMRYKFWRIEDVEDEEEKQRYMKTLNSLKHTFHFFAYACIIATLIFICNPLTSKGALIVECYTPEWIPYHVFLMYQSILLIFSVSLPTAALDFFTMSTLILLAWQFEMLNTELKKMCSCDGSTKNVEKDLQERIRRCVKHHDFITDFVARLNKTLSEAMLVYMAIIVISMCVELYIVSSDFPIERTLKGIAYTFVGMIQLMACYCLPAQFLIDQADEIALSAYTSNWYDHPTHSVKTAILMIMAKGQRGTIISAGGLAKINREMGLIAIKSMFTYCMSLRTISNNNK